MGRIAGSLAALLMNVIDYAGLFPPATLPLDAACERYRGYLDAPEGWLLNRLVLPASKLPEVELDGRWRGHRLSSGQMLFARREFAHSFGSCSFEEPVADLRELNLIP